MGSCKDDVSVEPAAQVSTFLKKHVSVGGDGGVENGAWLGNGFRWYTSLVGFSVFFPLAVLSVRTEEGEDMGIIAVESGLVRSIWQSCYIICQCSTGKVQQPLDFRPATAHFESLNASWLVSAWLVVPQPTTH